MMSGIEMAMMLERQEFYFWLPLVSFQLTFAKIPTPLLTVCKGLTLYKEPSTP